VFKNWDTKTYLWAGMVSFILTTIALVLYHADKEYVVASFGLTGQMVAGLLTYVNSNKPTGGNIESTQTTTTTSKSNPSAA
jgi:hypothetical protein